MTKEELTIVLENHLKWLKGDGGARASLEGANLEGASLRCTNLRYANLRGADLDGANLRGANLDGASLEGANLRGASLRGANLRGASLRGASLEGASLEGANLPIHSIVPEIGSFTAFKKVRCGSILVLEIPADAARVSSLVGRKCRASKLTVIRAESHGGNPIEGTEFQSKHDSSFLYTVGQTVECADFDDDIRIECTKGLHFFMTRKEAVNY